MFRVLFLMLIAFSNFSVVFGSENAVIDTVAHAVNHGHSTVLPSAFMVLPFVILLLMIATGPLFYAHF